MKNKKPPFEITNQIIDYVAEIAELIGRLNAAHLLSTNPTLRRANRIRTIHGSLAIEQNTRGTHAHPQLRVPLRV